MRLRFVAVVTLALTLGLQAQEPGHQVHLPTFPEFTCRAGMAYCNRAIEAGLHGAARYGRGSAFVDLDGDGWDDIFMADTDNRWQPGVFGMSMFFLNNRDGTFTPEAAAGLGIDDADLVATWNGSFADYDNDGDPDLLLANGGYSRESNLALYENRLADGGGFRSVTAASGIAVDHALTHPTGADHDDAAHFATCGPMLARWWGTSWADYDNDGLLDVVVTRVEGAPLLFHNDGHGTFSEVARRLGITVEMRDGKNPVWLDYDGDGDQDLYLAGIREHAFYRNDGGTTFTDVTAEVLSTPLPGAEDPVYGTGPFVFVAVAADFNQDGLDDVYLGRWHFQDVVLINDGRGGFTQHGTEWGLVTALDNGIDPAATYENTMGLSTGDLDDDGFPDVVIGTGSPFRAAPDIVFCNRAGKGFERCTDRVLAGADRPWYTRGHGTVFSDIDHDGDTDMLINLGGHPTFDSDAGQRLSPERAALFVNLSASASRTATLTLVGTRSNRDAIGARIRVAGSGPRYYVVRSMQGFQSQSSQSQVVSLGTADRATIEIRWPAGGVQTLEIRAGDRLTVTEP
jgi:hypothetical protein